MKCPECGGSGGTSKRPEGYHGDRLMWNCPTCQGSGVMELAVYCLGYAVIASNKTGNPYRPLSEQEVEELARLPKLDLIAGKIDVMYNPKGQLVVLRAGRKE